MWSLNALACLIFATTCQLYVTISNNYTRCHERDLVVYKLIFETNWTKENFPKQYPENRPPAHWSKVIGRFFFFLFIYIMASVSLFYINSNLATYKNFF